MTALARTLALLLTTAALLSPAAAVDITFDDVPSAGNPLWTVLDTWGYRFTGSFRTIDTPGAAFVSNGSAVYLGLEAAGVTVARNDGGPFALYEFDAAGLYAAPSGVSSSAQRVALLGLRVGGGLLQASYALGDLATFRHFPVPHTWHDLRAVTFTGLLTGGAPAALALDDVGVGEGPNPSVAEPGTLALALVATAIAGGAGLLRRRALPLRRR